MIGRRKSQKNQIRTEKQVPGKFLVADACLIETFIKQAPVIAMDRELISSSL
jgi:hypothetical protein